MNQATQLDNICFTYVPGLKHTPWPDNIYKIFMMHYKDKVIGKDRTWIESNYICNIIHGTTFSGHPTKTTLGNTIRSVLYAYFYCIKAGILTPWKSEHCFVIASGDDVVIFVDPRYV